jgi:hypothetical protein
MTIRYSNGESFEAAPLSQTERTMRLAVADRDEVVTLTRVTSGWVSDECEVVHVDFAWARQAAKAEVSESDCVCPHELAGHLIHMLYEEDLQFQSCPMPRDEHFRA